MIVNLISDCIFYVLKYLKFLGCLPLTEDKEGNLQFSWRSLQSLGSAVTMTIVSAISMRIFMVLWAISTENKMSSGDSFVIYFFMSVVAMAPLLGICMSLDSQNVIDYFEDWKSYQRAHEFITGRVLSQNNKRLQLFCVVLSVVKALVFATLSVRLLSSAVGDKKELSFWQFYAPFSNIIVYYFAVTDGLLAATLWTMKGVREAAEDLTIGFKECDWSTRNIILYRRLWVELSGLTSSVTDGFSRTLTIFITYGYLINMFCWYFFIIGVGDTATTLSLSLLTSIMTNIVPEACYRTITLVVSVMENEIIQIRRKTKLSDIQRKELEVFEQHLIYYAPEVELGGSYIMDRESIYDLYSAFIQVMIVIYTLKLQTKQLKAAKARRGY